MSKQAIKKIKAAIERQQKTRYGCEDSGNTRSAELAEFHENGLQEALDILQGKTKPTQKPVARKPKVKKPSPKIWTTKDGTKIPIKEMTDSHLVNTLKLLHRTAKASVERFVTAGNPFHGEMASDDFDRAQSAALEDPVDAIEHHLRSIPQFEHLETEALKRNLMWWA